MERCTTWYRAGAYTPGDYETAVYETAKAADEKLEEAASCDPVKVAVVHERFYNDNIFSAARLFFEHRQPPPVNNEPPIPHTNGSHQNPRARV